MLIPQPTWYRSSQPPRGNSSRTPSSLVKLQPSVWLQKFQLQGTADGALSVAQPDSCQPTWGAARPGMLPHPASQKRCSKQPTHALQAVGGAMAVLVAPPPPLPPPPGGPLLAFPTHARQARQQASASGWASSTATCRKGQYQARSGVPCNT